jgi:hypothetical protein
VVDEWNISLFSDPNGSRVVLQSLDGIRGGLVQSDAAEGNSPKTIGRRDNIRADYYEGQTLPDLDSAI